MAGIYNGPSRGGNRGGKDQFNWDDVKEDKQNQSYLGHSVKAPIGRWQKGRDLTWYTKQSKVDLKAAQEAERASIKAKEQDLMLQLLGEKPMAPAPRGDLDRIQKNKLLKKGDAEEGTVAAAISQDDFGERVEGIGYAPIKIDDLREKMEITTTTRLEGTGINDLLAAHASGDAEEKHPADTEHDHAALLAAIEGGAGAGMFAHADDSSSDDSNKQSKKAKKRLKKESKKRQKEEKKDKKMSKKSKSSEKSKSQDIAETHDRQPFHDRRGSHSSSPRSEDRRRAAENWRQDRSRSRNRDQRQRSRSRSKERGAWGRGERDSRDDDRFSERRSNVAGERRSHDRRSGGDRNGRDQSCERDRSRHNVDDRGWSDSRHR